MTLADLLGHVTFLSTGTGVRAAGLGTEIPDHITLFYRTWQDIGRPEGRLATSADQLATQYMLCRLGQSRTYNPTSLSDRRCKRNWGRHRCRAKVVMSGLTKVEMSAFLEREADGRRPDRDESA